MSAKDLIEIDHNDWPIVRYHFIGKQTDRDIDNLIASYEWCHSQGAMFGTIAHIEDFAAEVRHVKRLGKWMVANREITNKYSSASALAVKGRAFS